MNRRDVLKTMTSGAAMAAMPCLARASVPFEVEPRFVPQVVNIRPDYKPGTIVIETANHFLYLIQDNPRKAIRYGVGLGKPGLGFYGEAVIERKVKWPFWKPTAEMIRRSPKYAKYANGVKGGPNNPLGARALYLYQNGRDTMFRIHGTTQPSSIGRSVSNGCFRMINEHVSDLYERVPTGTQVIVG